MVAKAIVTILIALCAVASARELQQAPSPAPTMLPIADMAFILSADKVIVAMIHSTYEQVRAVT